MARARAPWTTQRLIRLGFAVATLALTIGAVYVVTSRTAARSTATPEPPPANQIAGLRERLAKNPCEAPSGELLVTQLIALGRAAEAASFGTDFIARCGENAVIRRQLEAQGHRIPAATK
jgi:hypothetical protein